MTRLLLRSLAHYWRTNAAVVGGVATAVAVLAGALLVGQSVRASLRDLLVERIGATAYAVSADRYFREDLLEKATLSFSPPTHEKESVPFSSCPIIAVPGILMRESSGRRAYGVNVYGVDERFWRFHGLAAPEEFGDRAAVVGAPLAAHLDARPGDSLLLRIETDRDIPGESLYGRRESAGRTIRLTCSGVASPQQLGEFALRPGQGTVFSVFVPLKRLQRDLAQPSRVNAVLFAGGSQDDLPPQLRQALRERASLSDVGLRLRTARTGARRRSRARASCWTIRSHGRRSPRRTKQARRHPACWPTWPTPSGRAGARFPTAWLPPPISAGHADRRPDGGGLAMYPDAPGANESIWLNEWAWRDLGIPIGEPVELEYYHWEDAAGLVTTRSHAPPGRRRGHWRRRGRDAGARRARHHRREERADVGPAVSARPSPHPAGGRSVLGPLSRHAEGVRHAGRRAGALAEPVRAADVGARRAAGTDAGRVAATPDRPRGGGVHRRGGSSQRPRRVPRCGRPRRVLPLLQLLPDRRRRAAVGVVLQARRRAAGARGRHAAGPWLPRAHAAAPLPLGRRRALDRRQPAGRCRRPRLRRRARRRPADVVDWRGRHRPRPPARLLGRRSASASRPASRPRSASLSGRCAASPAAPRAPCSPACWSRGRPPRGRLARSASCPPPRSLPPSSCWRRRPSARFPTSADSSVPARCCSCRA